MLKGVNLREKGGEPKERKANILERLPKLDTMIEERRRRMHVRAKRRRENQARRKRTKSKG